MNSSTASLLHARCLGSDSQRAQVCTATQVHRCAGERIAGILVTSKLAACCNLIPGLTSIYEWEGKLCNDSEVLMMIKSTQAALPQLTTVVQTEHSYDEVEVIAVPVVGGSVSYIDWVAQSVQPASSME